MESNNTMTELVDEGKMNSRIKNWIEVTRVQTAMVTCLAMWAGYVSTGASNIGVFVSIGILGILVHIYGFTLNEVKDAKYDADHEDVDGHPIAQGKINEGTARLVAWSCAILSILYTYLVLHSTIGTLLLIASTGAGYLYNAYSKKHWWSNIYLTAWVVLITFTGAVVGGSVTIYTWALAGAFAIQIFVQVIEGDLKDIMGSESTFTSKMGVKCDSDTRIVDYPSTFRKSVNGIKLIELLFVTVVVYLNIEMHVNADMVVLAMYSIVASVFVATSATYMVSTVDRDRIKQWSSIHELSSVILIGVSLYWLSPLLSLFATVAPVVWYLIINNAIHSSALNPDV